MMQVCNTLAQGKPCFRIHLFRFWTHASLKNLVGVFRGMSHEKSLHQAGNEFGGIKASVGYRIGTVEPRDYQTALTTNAAF